MVQHNSLSSLLRQQNDLILLPPIQRFESSPELQELEYLKGLRWRVMDLLAAHGVAHFGISKTLTLGAVLIKKYTSLPTNPKKVPSVFSQISSHRSTLKLRYATRRRTETPLPRRFWPILSSTIFVKIDPCGIYFANIIVPCRDFGNVVARGYYLRVPLRRRNRTFGAPKG